MSSSHSSSSSCMRAAQNATPAISLSVAVLILVEPKFHPFSFLAKSTISTTSPRRSSLTNFLCLPTLHSPEHRRHPRNLAALALYLVEPPPPSFPSTIPNCELLNLFPHLSLTAGEPPRQILIATARLLLFKSIRDPNASLCFFLGSCLQNTRPLATHPAATRSSTTRRSATPLSATFAEEKSQPMHTPIG
jgi:hypothetical protein